MVDPATCLICAGRGGDPELTRVEVWRDDLWRLTTSLGAPVIGFSYGDLVYVNVFGERIAHLHFNLAPHRAGDALPEGPAMVDPEVSPLSAADLSQTARRIRAAMAGWVET